MAKTDWKAEVKALKKKVKKLRTTITETAGPMADAARDAVTGAVSDVVCGSEKGDEAGLAPCPRGLPRPAPHRGRRICGHRRRHQIREPPRCDAGPAGPRNRDGRGLHHVHRPALVACAIVRPNWR